MARDDLEYLSLADFTPGIYSKYGAGTQLGKDGAAQVDDGRDHYTFGCYPDPDGGLRPLPRRVARYATNADDTLLDVEGDSDTWTFKPTARGVGNDDDGRRSKIGVIDAAVHEATRFDPVAYDPPPRRYDTAHGVARPDMVHIITSYREDPLPVTTDAESAFPNLGRLVNRWHAFSLSEVDQATGDIDLSELQYDGDGFGKPHRIVQQKAARVEESTLGAGGSFPADADFTSEVTTYIYDSRLLSTWRRAGVVHNGWAAGSLAVGRAIPYIVFEGQVTLDIISHPGRLAVVACLQTHLPIMAADSSEEVLPNFFSAVGGPFGMFTPNDPLGYPPTGTSTQRAAAGTWTATKVPWYLIEHQDRFVGVIQTANRYTTTEYGNTGTGLNKAYIEDFIYHEHNWDAASNQVLYTELNAIARGWNPTDRYETPSGAEEDGFHTQYQEMWKYVDLGGVIESQFDPGTIIASAFAPKSPLPDVLGNNLVARIGCMFSWQNDLVLVPTQGEGSIVRGSLEDPTVIRSGTVIPTGGVTCQAAQTPSGVVYGTTQGVVLWDGQGAKDISPQLDGWFWDCGAASETHRDGYRSKAHASMGRFTYSAPFVYAPNNWVMDLRTGAWTRLRDPIDENPYPYMHYVTNHQGDVYAVRGCYDGTVTGDDDLTEESYFMDCYSSDERTWRWQWVSQPMQSTITRAMKVSEIVIVAQGQGTIQIFLSGSDIDEEMTQFDFDSTRHPVRIARSVNIDTTDLVVRIDARGRGTSEATAISEAPTLHSIHLGSRTAHQVPRD